MPPGTVIYVSKVVQSINSCSKFAKIAHCISKNGDTIRYEKEAYISLASSNLKTYCNSITEKANKYRQNINSFNPYDNPYDYNGSEWQF